MVERILTAFTDMTASFQRNYFAKQCCIVIGVIVLYSSAKLILPNANDNSVFAAFLSEYFTDVLAPFALLGISNAIFSLFGFRVIRLLPTLLLCAVAGLAWELVAPLIIPWSISDPLDFIGYMIGGLLYWIIASYPERAKRSMQ